MQVQAEIERALALHRSGRLREAEQVYRSILRAAPQHFAAAHGLGVLCMQRGMPEQGESWLALATRVNPGSAGAHHDRGLALRSLGRLEEALASFDTAIALRPDFPAAHYHRGNLLLRMMKPERALASFDAAIALKPDHFAAFNDRGNALRELNRLQEALADYDRAVALQPGQAVTHCNRGFALQDLGRFEEALASYNRAIALDPGFYQARQSRGTLELLQGRMKEGFADFEYRLKSEEGALAPRLRAIPYWTGEGLSGKSILVYSDGAFGDLVQFCRYLPLLVSAGANVTLSAPARFHRILATDSLGVRCVSAAEDVGAADYRCELMSLPYLLKTELATIPPCIDHLARDPERTERWRKALPAGLKIGICWQGNPARNIDRGRSIPLPAFYPLSQVPGVRLVSLQKHHGLEQLHMLPAGMQVETLRPTFDEGPDAFVDTAAIMADLDVVVTSDTAVAHLAAALGRPTWIALRQVPEWRWLLNRDDSPWYPAARLFRQTLPDDWGSVFEEIAAALRETLKSRPTI
jgi:tetratricopeptide (TPR) repeat protein